MVEQDIYNDMYVNSEWVPSNDAGNFFMFLKCPLVFVDITHHFQSITFVSRRVDLNTQSSLVSKDDST